MELSPLHNISSKTYIMFIKPVSVTFQVTQHKQIMKIYIEVKSIIYEFMKNMQQKLFNMNVVSVFLFSEQKLERILIQYQLVVPMLLACMDTWQRSRKWKIRWMKSLLCLIVFYSVEIGVVRSSNSHHSSCHVMLNKLFLHCQLCTVYRREVVL